MKKLALIAIACILGGCLFETQAPFTPGRDAGAEVGIDAARPDATGGADTGGSPGSAATDDTSQALYPPETLSTGRVCHQALADLDIKPVSGWCSPVLQDCPETMVCDLVELNNGPTKHATLCREPRAGEWEGGRAGEECDPGHGEHCYPGLRCDEGTCRRWCGLDDARACDADAWCAPFDKVPYGTCVDDADACD